MSSDFSPLRKAFKDNGFNYVNIDIQKETYQPILSIYVYNTEASQRAKLENIISNTLKNIVKNGFDKKYFNQCFNEYEINRRESLYKSETVGLDYSSSIAQSWIYGGNPTLYLDESDIISKIKKESNKGYFEKFITKYILNNNNVSTVIIKPQRGLTSKKSKEYKDKLQKI